jgi:hypothetical protein
MPNYNQQRYGRRLWGTPNQALVDVFLLQAAYNSSTATQTWEKVGTNDNTTNYSSTTNPSLTEVRLMGQTAPKRIQNTSTGNAEATGIQFDSTGTYPMFTFPTKGIYRIEGHFAISQTTSNADDLNFGFYWSTDGGTNFYNRWYSRSYVEGHGHQFSQSPSMVAAVTNTSTDRFAAYISNNESTNNIYGSTAYENESHLIFRKIGEL